MYVLLMKWLTENKLTMNKTKRVYVDGVFDLFHEGHINLLRTAATYGTLIVGVHDDKYVESYKRKPVIPQSTRYEVVRACKYVSEVIEGVELLTDELIDRHKIDLVIHGDDFSIEDATKHYTAALNRGIYKTVPYTKEISSTKVIIEIEKRFSAT